MSKFMLAVPNFPGKEKMIATGSRVALKVSKHSPELCVGVGIAAGIGATVFACRATLRVGEVVDAYNETLEKINFLKDKAEQGEAVDNHSVEEAQKEKFILFVQTAVKIGKLYSPAIILGMTSIGFILGGHSILAKRNAALSIAYAGIQKAFDSYRERVKTEFGEEKESDIFHGITTKTIEEESPKGKTIKKKVSELTDTNNPYMRWFDEASCWWKKDAEQNRYFLSLQQNHANDLLRIRGHLFLNEVFDMLDLPRTTMGSVCGWVYGEGDSFVDFGVWDADREGARDFVNGRERSILLNFNCDGVIYDLI